MRYKFKKGDIIKYATDPYHITVDGALEYYHYLILNAKKHYLYDVLCLETGISRVMNKGDASNWATKVA